MMHRLKLQYKQTALLFLFVMFVLLNSSFVYSYSDITSCQIINVSDTYNLTTDLSNSTVCLRITANDSIIDGKGHTITGTANESFGIIITGRNVTIINLNFYNNTWGIYVNNTVNISISNGNFTENRLPPYGCTSHATYGEWCDVDAGMCSLCGGSFIEPHGASVEIYKSINVSITDIYFLNAGYYGLYAQNSSNLTIERFNGVNSSAGIRFSYTNSSTISNCNMNNVGDDWTYFLESIYLTNSNENIIINNTIYDATSSSGISVYYSNNLIIANNTIINQSSGIAVNDLSNAILINNTCINNSNFGFSIYRANNFSMSYNNMDNNTNGDFVFVGSTNSHFENTIDLTNHIDGGYHIYLNSSVSNSVFDFTNYPDAGMFICGNCTNVTYKNMVLNHDASPAIYLFNTTNSSIYNISFSLNYYGIQLKSTSGNMFYNNSFSDNYYGIYGHSSSNNSIFSNSLSNSYIGIYYYSSSNNTLYNNIIDDNEYGIDFYGSSNTSISNNLVNNNTMYGIYLTSTSINNTIANNVLSGNERTGIYLSSSNNNTVINNTVYYSGVRNIYIESSRNTILISNKALYSDYRGFQIYNSRGSLITGNNASGNGFDFLVFGDALADFNISIDTTNIVDYGYKVYYNYSLSNYEFNQTTAPEAGIAICAGCYNVTYKNLNLSHPNDESLILHYTNNSLVENVIGAYSEYNFYLTSSYNNTFLNITSHDARRDGVKFLSSSNNRIINSTFRFNNRYGIILDGASDNCNLTGNILRYNGNGIFFYSGSLGHNVYNNFISSSYYPFTDINVSTQDLTSGSLTKFNFTLRTFNETNCPQCNYSISLYPDEINLTQSKNGYNVTANFTPGSKGLYSIVINVTDEYNNTEISNYAFVVNGSNNTEKYYFGINKPTNGQAFPGPFTALSSQPPSSDGDYYKTWIGLTLNENPSYLFGIFKSMYVRMYYNPYNETEGERLGIEKYGTYGYLSESTEDLTMYRDGGTGSIHDNLNFSMDWPNNYFFWWNYLTFKTGINNEHLLINVSDPSYVNITYTYPSSPAIKTISNKYINVLSATMNNSDADTANIDIAGEGTTDLVLQMPHDDWTYSVYFDNVSCSESSSCTSNSQSSGEINLTLDVNSINTIRIVGTAPSNEMSGRIGGTISGVAYNKPEILSSHPVNKTLGTWQVYYFGVNKSGEIVSHELKINEILEDGVSFIFYSEPVEIFIKPGESKGVDLDEDRKYDVLLDLISFNDSSANFILSEFIDKNNDLDAVNESSTNDDIVDKVVVHNDSVVHEDRGNNDKFLQIVSGVFVIAFMFVLFFVFRSTKKKTRRSSR